MEVSGVCLGSNPFYCVFLFVLFFAGICFFVYIFIYFLHLFISWQWRCYLLGLMACRTRAADSVRHFVLEGVDVQAC